MVGARNCGDSGAGGMKLNLSLSEVMRHIIVLSLAVAVSVFLYSAVHRANMMEKALSDATRELETAKAGEEFYRNCLPGIMQRTVIELRQGLVFCKKYERRGNRIVEIERYRVTTLEAMLGYPLPRGNSDSRF